MINFETENDKIKINLDYDFETYQEIKKVNDALFDIDNEEWVIDSSYLKHLIKTLNDMNVDVSQGVKLLRNIAEHKTYNNEEIIEQIKTVRISVKENDKSLALGFDYNPKILETIKSLEQRQYSPKNKTWRVNKSDVNWIYSKLDELGYVDLTQLAPYIIHNSNDLISREDFPCSTITPYDFQINAVNTLYREKKMINGLEAGLGKTPITVMVSEYINKKTLVVCPASIKYNWENEIYKINPNADVTVLDGKSEWKESQYIILNYDILGRFIDNIMNSDIEIAVFDEAHKIRGVNGKGLPTSERAKLSLKIAKNKEYVFPITATPFINQTKDIFNLLKVIDHPMTKNWYSFANTYCGANRGDFGTSYNGSSNQERLNKRLYPHAIIRLRTEDHIDLPERMRSFIPVNISMTKYNKAVKDYMNNRKNLETNGQHLVYLGAMRRELAVAKAKESVKLIKDLLEQEKQVVFFTNYTEVVELICDKYHTEAVKVTGDVDAKDRQKAVDEFQSGKKRIFVGNIDAAGEGITLTSSHHMLVNDFHWSPVVMVNQMEKRIHRISQTQPCVIQYLYVPEATMDKTQLEMLEEKLNDSSIIIDGKKEEFFTKKLIEAI